MPRVSQQNPEREVARLRALVAAGGSTMLTGNPRQLRRIEAALREDASVDVFLGKNDDDEPVLHVGGYGPAGALFVDRIAELRG